MAPSLIETYNPKSQLVGAADKIVQTVHINFWLIAIITALKICFVEMRFDYTELQVILGPIFLFLRGGKRTSSQENAITCYAKAVLAVSLLTNGFYH